MNFLETLKKLWPFVRPYKREFFGGPVCKFIEAFIDLLIPLLMARVVDVAIPARDTSAVLFYCGIILVLGLVGLFFAVIAQYCAAKASMGYATGLRNHLFAHILSLSSADVDRNGSSTLITRISMDVVNTMRAIAIFIRVFTRMPMILLGSTAMVFVINPKLACIFLGSMIVIGLCLYGIITRSNPYYVRVQKWVDNLTQILREDLEGVRVVRAFNKQADEEARFNATSDQVMGESIRVGWIAALLNPVTYAVTNVAILLILWVGGIDANAGHVLPGDLFTLINYCSQILISLMTMSIIIPALNRAYASAKRVAAVMDETPVQKEGALAAPTHPDGQPLLRFDDVSFSYAKGGAPALSHISFSVMPGQTVGVIGGTGSGKSTLVNLLPRLYDATEGHVYVEGDDIRDYLFSAIRGKVGLVPQKAMLFAGTLGENLRYGNQDATDEELWEALAIAQAADFVKQLPQGLDAPVLQEGKNFSGGQRQRLTIARALVRKPQILVLDDSFSALDFATDAALRKGLRHMARTQNTTVFLVSQRAGTIRQADLILVLDDGQLVGMGAHDDLFKTCQVYREICLSQFSREEAEAY